MKKILLLRHAHSDQNHRMDDHERPLSAAGKESCLHVAAHLKTNHLFPDVIISSTATRARETAIAIQASLTAQVPVHYTQALYLASAGEIIQVINALDDRYQQVMLVGHNPGLHQCALVLAGHSATPLFYQQLEREFPPAAFVQLSCKTPHWIEIESGTGWIEELFFPS